MLRKTVITMACMPTLLMADNRLNTLIYSVMFDSPSVYYPPQGVCEFTVERRKAGVLKQRTTYTLDKRYTLQQLVVESISKGKTVFAEKRRFEHKGKEVYVYASRGFYGRWKPENKHPDKVQQKGDIFSWFDATRSGRLRGHARVLARALGPRQFVVGEPGRGAAVQRQYHENGWLQRLSSRDFSSRYDAANPNKIMVEHTNDITRKVDKRALIVSGLDSKGNPLGWKAEPNNHANSYVYQYTYCQ